MASLVLTGDTSGQVTISAPAVAGTNTLTLLAATATNSVNTLATAVASTSGTSIDFTGLPSWIKRITVMFDQVSTNGASAILIQLGDSGGIETTGYLSNSSFTGPGSGGTSSTTGIVIYYDAAARNPTGHIVFTNISGNTWIASGVTAPVALGSYTYQTAGVKTLSATLDRVRITTTNGTDTFDAGSVNILYEG
jgi:hypothetical protein